MAIKVSVGEPNTQGKPFPKLMLSPHKDYVLLLINESRGTVVWSKCIEFKVGDIRHSWIIDNFTDFNEPITLQND